MEHYVQAASIRWFNACAYYAVALSRGIHSLGLRVTFAGHDGLPSVEKARSSGIDVFTRPAPKFENPVEYITTIRAYRKFAVENDVTLVNVHNGNDHTLWALALRGTGIPLVRTSGNRLPPKAHIGSRLLQKKTAGFIASCNTVRTNYADRFGIDPQNIRVLNGGIDSKHFSPGHTSEHLRESLGIHGNAFVFGIIGRYSPVKGHSHFFRAAGLVSHKYPDARFVVSGWDAQLTKNDILKMAKDAGVLDKTGFVDFQHDIRDLIGAIDAGVVASTGSETVCRIAMEYMAMGIPVIAADTNVIPEVVRHGESGIIVPAGDHRAMASVMEQVMASKDKGTAMGQRGREIIETDYSLEAFAQQTLDAYRGFTGHA